MDLTLRYCDGWDWQAGKPVGWLTEEDAAETDWEGGPYSVVVERGGAAVAVLDIAWQHYYLAVSLADERGRRTSRTVYRRLPNDKMFPVSDTEWRYRPDQAHGDADVWRKTVTRELDGRTPTETERRGRYRGCTVTGGREDVAVMWRELPEFGEWWELLGFDVDDADLDEPEFSSRITGEDHRPWRPPLPLTAPYLDALMTPGATVSWEDGTPMTVRWDSVGELDMPSGRLVACDPGFIEIEQKPFTVGIAPGRYPVLFARAVGADHPEFAPEGAVVLPEKAGDRLSGLFPGNQLTVPDTDANLIGWSCYFGDGSYPTWIGRDATGAVVCFAADMLTLQPESSDDED